jgi:hypothetical protein
MNRVPVTSSNIKTVGYDDAGRKLQVEFNSGVVWEYADVPREKYDGLLEAEAAPDGSVGKYFYREIKGQFDGVKIEPQQEEAAA